MALREKQVIEHLNESGALRRARVVWHDQVAGQYFLIDLNATTTWPVSRSSEEIHSEIALGNIKLSLETPPAKMRHESKLSDADKLYRDRAYDAIKNLVNDQEMRILYKKGRGTLIKKAAQDANPPCSVDSIYNWLGKYWRGGLTRDALLPDYFKCGGEPGQRHHRGRAKIGRQVRNPRVIGANSTRNANRADEAHFDEAICKYHLGLHWNLSQTYKAMLSDHYFHPTPEVGSPKPKGNPPSKSQFYYYFRVHFTKSQVYLKRHGEKKHAANARATFAPASKRAFGPGSIYQIDSTTADVKLVHSISRTIEIGRPIVYLMVDVFSHLVTGLHVTLESPSYNAAAIALWNSIRSKVEFCKQFNYTIEPWEWPAEGVPHNIVADRAELISDASDRIIDNLGVTLTNTPSFRPDIKGIVERAFKMLNEKHILWLDGAVTKERDPGEKKCRDDALYTLEEFTRILIRAVLLYNRKRMRYFSPVREMIRDNLMLTPLNIWQWGMDQKTGELSAEGSDLVRLKLLPVDQATYTGSGIEIQGLYYSRDGKDFEAISEQARLEKRQACNVSYDPHCVDRIYLVGDKPGATEIFHLTPRSNQVKGCAWCEVRQLRKATKKSEANADNDATAKAISIHREQERERKEALKKRRAHSRTTELNSEFVRHSRDIHEAARNNSNGEEPVNTQSPAANGKGKEDSHNGQLSNTDTSPEVTPPNGNGSVQSLKARMNALTRGQSIPKHQNNGNGQESNGRTTM
jgi:hypothetical protein